MAGFLASAWEIGLSAALPVVVALAIFLAAARGPLAPHIRACAGIVGPYFASVSILFGLFAALLVNEVWQRADEAKRAVQIESDAVQMLAHFARANGIDTIVIPQLKAYVVAASAEDPYAATITASRSETGKAYLELLTTLSQAHFLDAPARGAMLTATRDLLRAHDERLYLANDITAPIKWLAILVFGAITQIALLLVHVDKPHAMRVAVGLFTIAFAFCLVIVAIFDAPFEIVLAGEPGTSLRLALDRL
jgi:hypothetical protein